MILRVVATHVPLSGAQSENSIKYVSHSSICPTPIPTVHVKHRKTQFHYLRLFPRNHIPSHKDGFMITDKWQIFENSRRVICLESCRVACTVIPSQDVNYAKRRLLPIDLCNNLN